MFHADGQTEGWTDMIKIITLLFAILQIHLKLQNFIKHLKKYLKLIPTKHPHSCDFRLGKRRSHKVINKVNRKGWRQQPCF